MLFLILVILIVLNVLDKFPLTSIVLVGGGILSFFIMAAIVLFWSIFDTAGATHPGERMFNTVIVISLCLGYGISIYSTIANPEGKVTESEMVEIQTIALAHKMVEDMRRERAEGPMQREWVEDAMKELQEDRSRASLQNNKRYSRNGNGA